MNVQALVFSDRGNVQFPDLDFWSLRELQLELFGTAGAKQQILCVHEMQLCSATTTINDQNQCVSCATQRNSSEERLQNPIHLAERLLVEQLLELREQIPRLRGYARLLKNSET